MKIVTSLEELQTFRQKLPEPVGLIPTMGFLHEGHLSLVKAARKDCASVVVSIFVNPTQFAPHEDLSNYPRDLGRDLALLEPEGVDLVWKPTPEIIYPTGFQTWVTVEEVTQPLEGQVRPGHFRGVTTVVTKLFNAVQPQKAYFGQKDAQQAVVIQRMTLDLNFPIQVIVCPIVREADGLAMSSRNIYLNPLERQAATVLHRALSAAKNSYLSGERQPENLRRVLKSIIDTEPLAKLQYVSCADFHSLQELELPIQDQALLSLVVFFGKTRLIDNMVIGNP